MHVLDLSSLQDWEILNALIELNPVGIVMLLIQSEKFPHCFVFLSFSTVGDLSGIREFSVKPLFLVAVFDGVFEVYPCVIGPDPDGFFHKSLSSISNDKVTNYFLEASYSILQHLVHQVLGALFVLPSIDQNRSWMVI